MEIVDWVAIFQYSLVIVLGVPGNGLVVWITTFEMKRSVNTLWFQHLAVADLLSCLASPFTIMYVLLGYWPLGLFTCKFISFIFIINMYASILILTTISIDRCLLVIKPIWCQNNRTLRKAHLTCAIMWILAAILTSPALIFQNVNEYNGTALCTNDYSLLGHHKEILKDFIAFCRLLLGFVIPFLVIIVCYTLLMYRVKLRFTHHTKTIKVSIAVIIGFFVCWLPYNVSRIILEMNDPGSPLFNSTIKVHHIFIGLAFMNSCINPIIYVLVGKTVKRKMRRSFKVIIKNILEETTYSDSNKTNIISLTKNTEAPNAS